MSYSHTKRRKTIKRLKKEFGSKFYTHLQEIADNICKKQDGPLLGNLEEILLS